MVIPAVLNKNIDYLKPWKTVPALFEAAKIAKDNEDAGFFEKIKIFFKSFKEQMKKVDKKEEKISKETQESVEKGVDETLSDFKKEVDVDDLEGDDKKNFNLVASTAVDSFESFENEVQAYALEGLKKWEKAANGSDEKMNMKEVQAVGAVAIKTMSEFKKLCLNDADNSPEKAKKLFKERLKSYQEATEDSNFPLKKLLKADVLGVFKVDLEADDGGGLLGISIGAINALDKLQGLADAFSLSVDDLQTLKGIGGKGETNAKAVNLIDTKILPKTSTDNVGKIIELIKDQAGSDIDVDFLTKLVFLADTNDLDRLARLLAKA